MVSLFQFTEKEEKKQKAERRADRDSPIRRRNCLIITLMGGLLKGGQFYRHSWNRTKF